MWYLSLSILCLGIWTIFAAKGLNNLDQAGNSPSTLIVTSICCLVGAVILGFFGYESYVSSQDKSFLDTFYSSIITELISIALVVLIIDQLSSAHAREKRKQHLLELLSGPDNTYSDLVTYVLSELRKEGWLRDGTLRKANLEGINLQGQDLVQVDLREANLRNASLNCAILIRAKLDGAILEGAHLNNARLHSASLRGAIFSNTEFQCACLHGADLSNVETINASFIGAKYDCRTRPVEFGLHVPEAIKDDPSLANL